MLILSCDVSDDKIYTISMKLDNGTIEKVSFMRDGLYSICYANCKNLVTRNGRVLKVVYSTSCRDRYILFDSSEDNTNRRERIYFDQIKSIKDITPIDSYRIAVKHGFKGTVEEWLESLKGHTPVIGVDFWTDEEKNALKEDVAALIRSEIGSIEEINKALESVKDNIADMESIKEETAQLVENANQKLDYVEELMQNAISSYFGEKVNDESDDDVIERILDGKEPKMNDCIVIKSYSEEGEDIYTSYVYQGSWVPANNGNVSSDNVIIDQDIEITTEDGETKVINTTGKSIQEVLSIVLSREIAPTVEEPRIEITLNNDGEKEVGGIFTPNYRAEFYPGSYSYGPKTGVEALEWEISDSNGNVSNNPIGSFEPFIITDNTNYYIRAKVVHGSGNIPLTSAKNEYGEGQILSGEKSAISNNVTGYRSYFYGANLTPIELNSTSIRNNLTNGNGSIPESFNIAIPEGTTQVVIALFDKSIESIKDTNAFGLDIISCFELLEMDIEGMSGFNSKPYKIYVYNPSVELGSSDYKVTIK